MTDNNFYNDDFEEKIDFETAEETEEACPKCGFYLYVFSLGRDPDNMNSWLVCKNCGYKEQE